MVVDVPRKLHYPLTTSTSPPPLHTSYDPTWQLTMTWALQARHGTDLIFTHHLTSSSASITNNVMFKISSQRYQMRSPDSGDIFMELGKVSQSWYPDKKKTFWSCTKFCSVLFWLGWKIQSHLDQTQTDRHSRTLTGEKNLRKTSYNTDGMAIV